jgi:hypothetical protein
LKVPKFGAFLAFELHEINSEYFVKLVYNPSKSAISRADGWDLPSADTYDGPAALATDPETHDFADSPEARTGTMEKAQYIKIPGRNSILPWEERELGTMKFSGEPLVCHRKFVHST